MTSYWISAAQSECRRQNRKIRLPPPNSLPQAPLNLCDGESTRSTLHPERYYTYRWKRGWSWPCFDTNFPALLCKSSFSYADNSLEGQGTKSTQQWSTTVKWSIQNDSFSAFWRVLVWKTGDNGETEQRSNALVWWEPQPLYKGAWEVRCLAVRNESKRYWTEKSRYINWLLCFPPFLVVDSTYNGINDNITQTVSHWPSPREAT